MKPNHLINTMFPGKAICSQLLQSFFRMARAFKAVYHLKKEIYYLEALPPHEVLNRLKEIGLRSDWVLADFDEVITEQSSQQIWVKRIIRNHKGALPDILWKYIHHLKWKENLYELNKIFRYSDGIEELESSVIPHLTLNKNALNMLIGIREKKLESSHALRKLMRKSWHPAVNLVIFSCNTGTLIKLFLGRKDILKRLCENKIIVRAVVANKMAIDAKGNIQGLSHRDNIIDIHTKKDYIPKNHIVLIDNRDRSLKQSHTRANYVPPGRTGNRIGALRVWINRFHDVKHLRASRAIPRIL